MGCFTGFIFLSFPYIIPLRFPPPFRKEPAMSVARVTEIKSSSTKSFDDALKEGLSRATKTLKNVKSAWIANQEVLVDDDGKITEYRVQLKVTFILED
jgi:flavin-binding protein dodecin